MRALFESITNLEQLRFREWSRHELDPHGQSAGSEASRHAHGGKAEHGSETAVVAGIGQIHERGVGKSVRANQGWRVIVRGIDERVQPIVGHQLQYDLPGFFSQ